MENTAAALSYLRPLTRRSPPLPILLHLDDPGDMRWWCDACDWDIDP
jgi:hypothetical protein